MDIAFKNKVRWIDYEECKFILAVVGTASGLGHAYSRGKANHARRCLTCVIKIETLHHGQKNLASSLERI